MLPGPCGTSLSSMSRAVWLGGILLLLLPIELQAGQNHGNVFCREEISPARREQLAAKLRNITGLSQLRFDDNGFLRTADDSVASGGSQSAKQLLANAISGPNVVVIEEASNSSEVAFCRVVPGKWKENAAGKPPVFVIQIDFADFEDRK